MRSVASILRKQKPLDSQLQHMRQQPMESAGSKIGGTPRLADGRGAVRGSGRCGRLD